MSSDTLQFVARDEFINELQRLSFEYDMRADICQRIVSRDKAVNPISLRYYERLTYESKIALDTAKSYFTEVCVLPIAERIWGDGISVAWEIPDYRDKICVVTKRA